MSPIKTADGVTFELLSGILPSYARHSGKARERIFLKGYNIYFMGRVGHIYATQKPQCSKSLTDLFDSYFSTCISLVFVNFLYARKVTYVG